MAPYVPLLMPELQAALVDPLPEVRGTAAKALGSLLRGMGEQHFAGLMPWLLATLKSEARAPCSRRHAVPRHPPCLGFWNPSVSVASPLRMGLLIQC
jgi:hypothetical protein